MKKYIFLVLMVFSLGVFAASVDLGVKGSLQLNPQANKDNSFGIGQTDITLSASNKNIAFNYVINAIGPVSKYAWVEGKIFGGTAQVGVISPIVSNYFGGGFYGDSEFFGVAKMDGKGVSFATGPWTVAYTGAASLLNDGISSTSTAGKLAVAYKVCDSSKVAIIMNDSKIAKTTGYDLYVEKSMSFGALDLSAQVIWGLQAQNVSVLKQIFAVYANYSLDKTQSVFCTFIDDIADVRTVKSLSLGYAYAVNDSVTAIVDYTNDMSGVLTNENATVGLNFAL
ncbi:MAG: hypothetical protein WCH76_06160 [Candidatus Riflemargulisbacteria bacterium]